MDKRQGLWRASGGVGDWSWRREKTLPAVLDDPPALPDFDYVPMGYEGPGVEEMMRIREKHWSKAIFKYYKKPLAVVEGKMQYVFDEAGRRYLDAIGGIVTVSVGHCHPEVVLALEQQNRKLHHSTTLYLNPEPILYSKELSERFPPGLDVVFFCNSGSEASELAALLAKVYSGGKDMIALDNAYHGWTNVAMGLVGMDNWKQPKGGDHPGVHHVPRPDPYRGVYGLDKEQYLKDLDAKLAEVHVAGFISEPIQGAGGCVTLLPGYLSEVYKKVRAAGGVCIADEVQCGFGRVGTHYWGFQREGVVPDIVTMAKGIGNGLNLAAVVTTREIADSIVGKLFFNTFAGNPMVSAGGRAVLRAIDKDQLQANSLTVGNVLLKGLRALQEKHSIIGDVRGAGLMTGVELVKDRQSKEPASSETAEIFEKCKDFGLLIGKGGKSGNVLRIKPPMCCTTEDVDFIVNVLDHSLSGL